MEHIFSLFEGLGLGVIFVGVMGFAINATLWPALIALIIVGVAIPATAYAIMEAIYVERQENNTRVKEAG